MEGTRFGAHDNLPCQRSTFDNMEARLEELVESGSFPLQVNGAGGLEDVSM